MSDGDSSLTRNVLTEKYVDNIYGRWRKFLERKNVESLVLNTFVQSMSNSFSLELTPISDDELENLNGG